MMMNGPIPKLNVPSDEVRIVMTKKTSPRIICVGANLESEVVLHALSDIGVNLVGLVTKPPAQAGSTSDYVDLHPFCMKTGISTIDTADINSVGTLEKIAALQPDYIFTLGWSQLFRSALLRLPTHFVVGSHPSPLPKGRGRAPVPWAILLQESRGAVSLFRMDVGVDSGHLLYQLWFDIPPNIFALDLYHLVAENLAKAFCELHEQLCHGSVTEMVQDESLATYRAKRGPADGHIDFGKDAEAIDRLIRAVSVPYPGAYTYYGDEVVRVWRSELDKVPDFAGMPGQILARKDNKLLVHAGDRPLWLYQLSDVDGMSIPLNVFRIGSKFGYSLEDEIHQLRLEIARLSKQVR